MAPSTLTPRHRFGWQHLKACLCLTLIGVLTTLHAPLRAAISLSAVAPLGASVGATVQITGTGFAPVAANNRVTLTSPSGVSRVAIGQSIVVVNAATGLRRLAIAVPAGLPTGTAAIQVQNTTTNEVAGGRSLEIIALTVSPPVSAVRGTSGVSVRIAGSPNTLFVAGRTSLVIGSGVSVTAVQVLSATELIATIAVTATAALGPRTITVASSTQTGLVSSGLQVVDAPPPNRAPVAAAGPDQTLAVRSLVQLDGSASSDPDGNPLTFTWSFASRPAASTANLTNPTAVNPTFVIDVPGTYEVDLIVSDGNVQSPTDRVTISTMNSPPVASAGADASAFVQDTVTLNGSASSDVDGDALTYAWSLVDAPAGSGSSLSQPTAVNPTLVIDVAGIYVLQLIVNDGLTDSAPDTITITTLNSRPVANAGADIVPAVGVNVQLDGSASTDIDGQSLSFLWSLTLTPPGSAAVLSDPAAVKPTFDVDLPGAYIAQLIVNDGSLDSAPDTVNIATQNGAPLANAGPAQTVVVGATVQLDGSASSDSDGDVLSFRWSLAAVPTGSTAVLSDATNPLPTFVADRPGDYVAQLIVNDGSLDSAPQTVMISTNNSVPIANAGPDQAVATGVTVQLDGSGSSDPDGTPLQTTWSLTVRPSGSNAALSNPGVVNPTFFADIDGTYVAQLIVGDGTLVSSPDTVTISSAPGADLALSFFEAASNPAVGSSIVWGISIHNLGPANTSDVRIRAAFPAGYTFTAKSVPVGSYDETTGIWTIGPMPSGSGANLAIVGTVNSTGPYDLTATVVESSAPDPNLANNTRTQIVTPNGDADLALSFFEARDTPPVGSTQVWGVQVHNIGPAIATFARIHAPLPAGYTFLSANMSAGTSYDVATGIWTIGPPATTNGSALGISYRVNATGPYDLVASIIESDRPDPNLANNARTVIVTPQANADLQLFFHNFGPGTRQPGEQVSVGLVISNNGPAQASNVVVEFKIPAGFTFLSANVRGGTYDPTTGLWAIGDVPAFLSWDVGIHLRVNATGPLQLNVAITNSSAPDPNPANNVIVPARNNRPPVANAGIDQSASTNAVVNLDGSASFDADGDPITFEWTSALRPINSAATFSGPTAPAPTFTPDLPGNYVSQLIVRDSLGIASAPDSSSVIVIVTNSPPAIVTAPVTSAAVAQPYQYDVNATDPDFADLLTFSLTTAPAGMTIDQSTGVIDWTPTANQAGPQAVVVRAQDASGLFATQSFAVQVSSPGNGQPVALDDAFEVRVSESLGVSAPGVVGNDTDESPLTARLVSPPGNGTVQLTGDGSFTYTPHTINPGELVLVENVNLAARIPGVTVFRAAAICPRCAIDESLSTKWESLGGPIEIVFPAAVTVSQVKIVATRNPFDPKISAGIFELIDGSGAELYDSGQVEILGPTFDATLNLPNVHGVRRVRFTPTASPTSPFFSTLAEVKVIGSGLIRRERFVEPNLVQLLPATVTASSELLHNVKEGLTDDNESSTWYSHGNAGDFIEVTFPLDVTVTQLKTLNPAGRPDGFGSSNPIACSGTFTFLDPQRAVLFDSGIVNEPSGFVHPSDFFTLDVPGVAGVRHVRYTMSSCSGSFPAGFAELRVFGTADVTTPAFGLGEKFQALGGREVHSTPIVINLTDDNGDGAINTDDIPDIVVPVEAIGDQLKGEIKAISGDDGRELFTAGGPNLVSPWSELAAGDIDGDGQPEIIAVHSDGSHLIAFEHTGALKWVSGANPMPSFNLGSIVYTGAISIANLDGTGAPEIIIGASVFDANGALLSDGRTLNGTTAGTGLRSAISTIGDIDLDGTPELVAGPTVYRLANGQLTKVWQRADRPDGYVAIANLDDDPQAEIVSVANGVVYVLNHDGSDDQGWNAPTHAPVSIPGGGQGGAPLIVDVDGDGVSEVGVAGASHFVLFNRDGSVRWKSAISDRSSNSTGAVAFDLNGDGSIEIIYRDEFSLRIYRGSDGVLLVRTPVGSATWAEEPVVADVDNDGHADIVVASDFFAQSQDDTGVIVFQDVANKWKRTRRIWNQHSYHVTNVNEDATIPLNESAHWLVSGLNAFRTNAFVPGESEDETDSFTYVASDGVLDSNVATVRIAIRTPNSGPQITSTPITSAADGVTYGYAAQAVDPDAGDILTFSLPTAPAGMSIDPQSGLLLWVPTAAQQGLHSVIVKVADVRGLFALQGYQITVAAPLTVPDIVGQLQTSAGNAIAAAGLTIGGVTSRLSAATPQGAVISQNPVAGAPAALGAPVSFVVSLGPPPVGTVPNVVGLTQATAQQDVQAAGFTTALAGQNNSVVPAGVVMSQNPPGGTVAPSSTIVNLVVSLGPPPGELDLDLDGFTGNQGDCNDTNAAINPFAFDTPGDGIDQNCNGVDSVAGDASAPAAAISTPADLAEIMTPTDIAGTATDSNFLRYSLTIAGVDASTTTIIGSGTSPVSNGVLGRLDPTLLENGLYRITLVVEDVNGQQSIDERVYRVTGEAKVGAFRVSFEDLSLPVAGIPIVVRRTYDSRVKSLEDFGIGWTLDLSNGHYQHNRTPGRGWIIRDQPFLGEFLPCIGGALETLSHLTEVRLSDRESYLFALEVTNGNVGITGACEGTARFRFIDGTIPGATLEILDSTSVIYLRGGPDTILDMNTFLDGVEQPYDPQRVRLTRVDGTKIELDRQLGIVRIVDSNGNALSLTPGGLVHSSGKMIAIARDALGRITQITDPLGKALRYEYDGRGDLVRFVDRSNNTTTFDYDARHNLIEIRDPLGNAGLRSEYDGDGRLTATIDAQGNRVELTHDLAARRDIVRDRLGRTTVHEYDAAGHVTGIVNPLGGRRSFTFDARGNQLTDTDPIGRVATRTYDAADNVLTATDVDGNTTTFTYDVRRRVTTRTDAEGRLTSLFYDSRGNLVSEVSPEGGVTRYAYDAAGNIVSTTDPLGKVTNAARDGAGNLITLTDPLGNVVQSSYDASGRLITEQRTRARADGQTEIVTRRQSYDASGQFIASIDALGNSLGFTFTPSGQISEATDRLGTTVRHRYDSLGNLIQTLFVDGTSTSVTYDANGRTLSATNRDGQTTQYEYDALGRQVKVIHPDATATSRAYDAAGRLITSTDERNNQTVYSYQPNQQTLTDALGGTSTFDFNSRRNRTRMVDALGRNVSFEYDSASRLTRTRFADGSMATASYDLAGRRIAFVDQAGRRTSFGYDALGRMVGVTDASLATTGFAYDSLGNLVSHTDALSRRTTLAYDAAGRLVQRQRPMGQQEAFSYDANGKLLAHTDYNGRMTSFTYDSNRRLILKSFEQTASVAYEYSPDGLRTRAGSDRYMHDARGRMIRVTTGSNDVVSYTYDAAGNRTSVTSAFGTTSYTYDALNRMASAIDAGGTTTFTYDAVGNAAGKSLPNGVTVQNTYDALNRLTLVVNNGPSGLISSYAYTLAPDGKRTRVVESGPATSGRTVDYTYDSLGRLIVEQIDEPNDAADQRITYEYDAVGNRLSKVAASRTRTLTTTYTYDANDRLLTETTVESAPTLASSERRQWLLAAGFAATPIAAAVLALGLGFRRRRMVNIGLAWRAWFRRTVVFTLALTQVFLPARAYAGVTFGLGGHDVQPPASNAVSYTYDANGNMLTRSDGMRTDTYAYDMENRLVAATMETGANAGSVTYTYDADGVRTSSTVGTTVTRYIVDKALAVPQVLAEVQGGTATVIYSYGVDLLAQDRPGTGRRFYLFDGQGSTRQLTSTTGTTTDTYTFDAFGVMLSSTGTTANLYLYNGQQLDPDVGFYYLRARYYAQATGRFVTADPFQGTPFDPPSLHRYLYANADPVNHSDPLGLTSLAEIGFTMAVQSIFVTLALAAVGAIVGGVVGGPKGVLIGVSLGIFVGLVATPAGRVLLAIAGEKAGVLTLTARTAGPQLGRVTAGAANKVHKAAQQTRGLVPPLFLPEAEQQPAIDQQVGPILNEDPEGGPVFVALLLSFLKDALLPMPSMTVGVAAARPLIDRLEALISNAAPPRPLDLIPEED